MQRNEFIGSVSHVQFTISRNNRRLFTHLNHSGNVSSMIVYIRVIFYLYSLIPLRLSRCLNFSLESVRALYAGASSSFPLPLLPLALPWKKGLRGLSLSDLTERRTNGKGYVQKARKDGYLATKLFCLMLVADVARSVLKELRASGKNITKSSGKLGRHLAKRDVKLRSCRHPAYSRV